MESPGPSASLLIGRRRASGSTASRAHAGRQAGRRLGGLRRWHGHALYYRPRALPRRPAACRRKGQDELALGIYTVQRTHAQKRSGKRMGMRERSERPMIAAVHVDGFDRSAFRRGRDRLPIAASLQHKRAENLSTTRFQLRAISFCCFRAPVWLAGWRCAGKRSLKVVSETTDTLCSS